ncbi:MAG: SUMF1/EgtB/PvdO family nonheme iron enzyme [Prevotellaceae bacterium]|jgi:formylglycine-generating enzyme required for sulfatase activity/serine/threonine protein kinase|nr:SUMF1/EgtB/PvdO family nonheme iron enzyme [Prevotellaceae bacterium]
MTNNEQQLRKGTALRGQQDTYIIRDVLGQGGFGITYLATMSVWVERQLGRIEQPINVAIKEFFMKDYCERDSTQSTHVTVSNTSGRDKVNYYRNRFIKEANNVSKLQHEHIVRVLEVFDANNTTYIAMEYIEGVSMAEYVRAHGALSEQEAIGYIRQVAAALDYTHTKNIIHLDLKPANILRRHDGIVKVIDFGLSKQYDAKGEANSSSINPAGISEGYSPLELYTMGSLRKFSPASDIYSLGATLYFLLTAQTPPNATDVSEDGLPPLPTVWSKQVKDCITQSMQSRRKDRPQSIKAFLAVLDGDEVVEDEETKALQKEEETKSWQRVEPKPQPKPILQPAPKPEPPVPPKKRANRLVLLLTGITISVVLIAYFLFFNNLTRLLIGILLIGITISVVLIACLRFFKPKRPKHSARAPKAPHVSVLIWPGAVIGVTLLVVAVIPFYPQLFLPQGNYNPGNVPSTFEPDMVFVEGDTFMMGSSGTEQGRSADEVQHQVTLSSFSIGKYEVTQAQWKAVMGNNPSEFKYGDNYPVENVSWDDAQEFCNRLSSITGKQYRLPTEAEWEYASRGGNRSRGYKYSGSNNSDNVAWYGDNSGNSTHPVGQKLPNELGIYDMSGNVWEWCSDWYGSYSTSDQTDPDGSSSGSLRVLRGGGWSFNAKYCRSAIRNVSAPGSRLSSHGFRVVASAPL